jgi:tetratricopeptide (TPR) repeat protein
MYLALTLQRQHKWEEALCVLNKQLLPLTVMLYTEKSVQHRMHMQGAIECCVKLKQFGEARKLVDRQCELIKDLHGEDSVQYSEALMRAGNVLCEQQDGAGALQYYERAKLPKEHRNYGFLIDYTATALLLIEEYERALPLRLAFLEIVRQDELRYATGLYKLAFLYAKLARFDLAIEYVTKGLEIDKRALSPNHPNTVIASNSLARYQIAIKDEAYALKTASNKRMCHACSKVPNDYYYTCSRCRQTTYCGEACQHADWPEHAKTCIEYIGGCSGCAKRPTKQQCRACGNAYCSAECRANDTEHTTQCVRQDQWLQ